MKCSAFFPDNTKSTLEKLRISWKNCLFMLTGFHRYKEVPPRDFPSHLLMAHERYPTVQRSPLDFVFVQEEVQCCGNGVRALAKLFRQIVHADNYVAGVLEAYSLARLLEDYPWGSFT